MNLNDFVCADVDLLTNGAREKLEQATYVGIDFGTSTTTVTRLVYNAERRLLESQPLAIAQEHLDGTSEENTLIPTVIAMRRDGHLLFGCGAKSCLLNREMFARGYNVWAEFKMCMGENACYPNTMMSHENTPCPGTVIETPKDATMHFFAYLKTAIEAAVRRDGLPETIRYAVTVPASFAPNQREELCGAIRAAGIDLAPEALLDEPNSAFLGTTAYYAEQGGRAAFCRDGHEANVLIFDFGAGTCDISLLKVQADGRTQNLAISHFTALGGRNIDEKIVDDILYPRLVEGRSGDDLPVLKVRQNLENVLIPVAERLKVSMCTRFPSDFGESAFARARENPDISVSEPFDCKTRAYGTFDVGALTLTAKAFVDIMEAFSEPSREAFENGHKSIFDPIDEVLRKASLVKEDLQFVLMVGGSSMNPFITEKVRDYFPRSVQVLEVGDPRTLVARGASIHSFAVNGFGESFIQPITSEDIFIKTASGTVRVFAAGTPVPVKATAVPDLYIDEQAAASGRFGIPFYASVDERELGVARFQLDDVAPESEVRLMCSLDADKTLHYEIEVGCATFRGEFAMPVSSEDVPPEQIAFVKAKNELDRVALCNRGVPTVAQYKAVARAAEQIEKYAEAAEYYRDLMYMHRAEHFEADVARCFREARNVAEALRWMRKACDYRATYLNVWYMVWDARRAKGWNDEETKKWLNFALANWPDDLDFQYVKMKALEGNGLREDAYKLAEQMCDEWEAEGVASLEEYTLGRFEEVARICGREALVRQIRDQQRMISRQSARKTTSPNYALVSAHIQNDGKEGIEK